MLAQPLASAASPGFRLPAIAVPRMPRDGATPTPAIKRQIASQTPLVGAIQINAYPARTRVKSQVSDQRDFTRLPRKTPPTIEPSDSAPMTRPARSCETTATVPTSTPLNPPISRRPRTAVAKTILLVRTPPIFRSGLGMTAWLTSLFEQNQITPEI